MLRHLVLFALAVASVAAKRQYDNYRVYRIIPSSNEQLELLRQLQNDNEGYSYWIEPRQVFQAADLMVSPDKSIEFSKLMDSMDMRYATYIENVQKLIDQEQSRSAYSGSEFNWTRYHTLEEIHDWLHKISAAYPEVAKVVDAGRSYEGRALKGIKLSFGNASKPAVFIEGGIHAREWISPATVTYFVNALLTSNQPKVRQLASAYEWHIFPVLNPDGYVYTHETDRAWRKTRSPNKDSQCFGADSNRNWGYKWMHGGASDDPCSNNYAGSKAFSEPETENISKYVRSIGDKLFGYIAFHCYRQVLMYPYGYTLEHLGNYEESKSIALKAVNALAQRYGTKYRSGTIYETMYVSSGSSLEWAKGTLDVPISFAYELRDEGKHGFILPAEQIIPNCEEVLDSLISIFDEAAKLGYPMHK